MLLVVLERSLVYPVYFVYISFVINIWPTVLYFVSPQGQIKTNNHFCEPHSVCFALIFYCDFVQYLVPCSGLLLGSPISRQDS